MSVWRAEKYHNHNNNFQQNEATHELKLAITIKYGKISSENLNISITFFPFYFNFYIRSFKKEGPDIERQVLKLTDRHDMQSC